MQARKACLVGVYYSHWQKYMRGRFGRPLIYTSTRLYMGNSREFPPAAIFVLAGSTHQLRDVNGFTNLQVCKHRRLQLNPMDRSRFTTLYSSSWPGQFPLKLLNAGRLTYNSTVISLPESSYIPKKSHTESDKQPCPLNI